MSNNVFLNCIVYKIIRQNIVERDRPLMIWSMPIAYWIHTHTHTHTHTLRICNICYFPTVAMFARTRLNVALYANCLSWC